jgi:NADH dehydrogenase FAD-containing subunit
MPFVVLCRLWCKVGNNPGSVIYALGDCASYPWAEPRLFMAAMRQSKTVAGNIMSASQGKPLTPLKPGDPMMMVPLGPKDGAGYMGSRAVFDCLVPIIKSRDLFCTMIWQEVNQKGPPTAA